MTTDKGKNNDKNLVCCLASREICASLPLAHETDGGLFPYSVWLEFATQRFQLNLRLQIA